MQYNLHFDMAAVAITAVILVSALISRWIPTDRNRAYRYLVTAVFLTALCNALSWYMEMAAHPVWYFPIRKILDTCYHMFHIASGLCYLNLVYRVCNLYDYSQGRRIMTIWPMCVVFLLLVINLFVPVVFSYTPEGLYREGLLVGVIGISWLYYHVIGTAVVVLNRKFLTKRAAAILIVYTIAGGIALISQLFEPKTMPAEYINALNLVLMYLNVESADEIKDDRFGVLTRAAFIHNAQRDEKTGAPVHAIFVRITETHQITSGVDRVRMELLREVVAYLKRFENSCWIAVWDDTCFALEMKRPNEKREVKIMEQIEERFHEVWTADGDTQMLGASIWRIRYPEDVSTIQELTVKVNLILPLAAHRHRGIISVSEIDFNHLGWRKRMLERAQTAVQNGTVEVRYEPIVELSTNKVVTARTVCFFKDEDGTSVEGNAFINSSGQEELLAKLDEYVFSNVVSNQAELIKRTGIVNVATRLSYSEITSLRFEERLRRILERGRVDYRTMLLRISEGTYSLLDEDSMNRIRRMQETGWNICIDDFGSGQSFLSRLIDSQMEHIVMHANITDAILNSEDGRILGRGLVSLIHGMHKTITLTGLKTEEQLKLARQLGVDYSSGPYFSEPVSPKEFILLTAEGGRLNVHK